MKIPSYLNRNRISKNDNHHINHNNIISNHNAWLSSIKSCKYQNIQNEIINTKRTLTSKEQSSNIINYDNRNNNIIYNNIYNNITNNR